MRGPGAPFPMLRLLADVRPEERRTAAAATLTLFGILGSHTLLETARDALFLAELPARQLPWAYLAIAALAVVITRSNWRCPSPIVRRFGLSLLLLACAGVTAGIWWFDTWEHPWLLRALYVWTGLFGTLSGLQFWLVLSELYTVTQAKRLYRLVAAGSLLGAVAGSFAAQAMVTALGTESLLIASAATLIATAAGPALLLQRPRIVDEAEAEESLTLSETKVLLRRNPYIAYLGGLLLVATVALTLADYVFKSVIAREVPAEQLGYFFAVFYLTLNVLALLVQVFLMGLVLETFGLHRSLLIMPALMLIGSAGIMFGGGVLLALVLKGADGTFRHSLHRTSVELLFVPIPDGLRRRVKPILDVVGQRGGQALASLFILAELGVGRGDAVLAAVAATLCGLWILLAVHIRGHYVNLFRSAIGDGSIRISRDLPDLDLNSLEAVFGALGSPRDSEVIGAIDFLAAQNKIHLVPALILYHPAAAVKLRALELFVAHGRTDFLAIVERLIDHEDPEVRAAALLAATTTHGDQKLLRRAREDPAAIVRATALAGLVANGEPIAEAAGDTALKRDYAECLKMSAGHGRSQDVSGCLALARAIAARPSPAFAELLLQLARAGVAELRVAAARAMARIQDPLFVDALIPLLDSRDTRAVARAALVAQGGDTLARLDAALGDAKWPRSIRSHIPRTMIGFDPADAVARLERHLIDDSDGLVRFKVLRALGSITARQRGAAVAPRVSRAALERTLFRAFQLIHWRSVLTAGARRRRERATPGHELMVQHLHDKEVHAVERIFRLLGLIYRGENFELIYRDVHSDVQSRRANSRELLENLLGAEWRGPVTALVDEVDERAKLDRAGSVYAPSSSRYEDVLDELLDQRDEIVRSLAANHVGELRLAGLRGRLEALDAGAGSVAREVVARALRLLDRPQPRWAPAR